VDRRPPNLSLGYEIAAKRVGDTEAGHLVFTRPRGVLLNEPPQNLPGREPAVVRSGVSHDGGGVIADARDVAAKEHSQTYPILASRGLVGRLRRFFE
jgi:hypothetical protein